MTGQFGHRHSELSGPFMQVRGHIRTAGQVGQRRVARGPAPSDAGPLTSPSRLLRSECADQAPQRADLRRSRSGGGGETDCVGGVSDGLPRATRLSCEPDMPSSTTLQPRCNAVDQSEPRRRKRGGETLGDDLFVPKELGWALDLGRLFLSPAALVHRRPRLSAAVRRRCLAVRHAPGM